MEKEQLLAQLNSLVGKYEQHRMYIDRARGQIGKFKAEVIEKVILDHEIKSSEISDQVNPLIPDLQRYIIANETELQKIHSSKGGIDEEVQELELRQMIGEMTDEEFEQEVQGLRDRQSEAGSRIAAIEADLTTLREAEGRWGKYADVRPAKAPEPPAPVVVAPPVAPPPVVTPAPVAAAPVAAAPVVEPVAEPARNQDELGMYVTRPAFREDFNVVFTPSEGASSRPAQVSASGNDDDVAIEVGEGASDGMQVSFDDGADGGETDFAGGDVDFEGGEDGPPVSHMVAEPSDDKGDKPRRALLLYQEGTAEEQIYPFTGDVLTVGRGRENDIQIKNDSKVSRYHCRITRQGNNFYIEDVKSSNGTLVNGELITDRRLFGGEEVIIGETFFRFRIME